MNSTREYGALTQKNIPSHSAAETPRANQLLPQLATAYGRIALALNSLTPEDRLKRQYLSPVASIALSLTARLDARERFEPGSLTPEIIILNKVISEGPEAAADWESRDLELATQKHGIHDFDRFLNPLNGTEAKIFDLLTSGASNREVAGELDISSRSLPAYKAQILAKMDAGTMAAAVTESSKHGWLPPLKEAPDGPLHLSGRQREILRLFGEGAGEEDIASKLGISTGTLGTHLQRAMESLGAKNRLHGLRIALENRVLDKSAETHKPEKHQVLPGEMLTDRQREVIRMLSDGMEPIKIARALGVSEETVWLDQKNITIKLDVRHKGKVSGHSMAESTLKSIINGDLELTGDKLELDPRDMLRLSTQHYRVLEFLIEGFNNEEISQKMGLAKASLRKYITNLYDAFQANSRPQLVSIALISGVAEILPEGERSGDKTVKAVSPLGLRERLEGSDTFKAKALLAFIDNQLTWKTYDEWAELIEPGNPQPAAGQQRRLINTLSRSNFFEAELAKMKLTILRKYVFDEDGKRKTYMVSAPDNLANLAEVDDSKLPLSWTGLNKAARANLRALAAGLNEREAAVKNNSSPESVSAVWEGFLEQFNARTPAHLIRKVIFHKFGKLPYREMLDVPVDRQELEVLQYLSFGFSPEEIAPALTIKGAKMNHKMSLVEEIIPRILAKLEARNEVQAVYKGFNMGLLGSEDEEFVMRKEALRERPIDEEEV